MKKTLFLSFMASLLITGTTYANNTPELVRMAINGELPAEVSANAAVNAAIKVRQNNYLREKLRDGVQRNVNNQSIRHTLSRAEAGIDGVSTYMDRSGELTDYSGRRPFTYSRVIVPNNAKRNFRTRAYDYYIEGGSAGTSVLESDVVRSGDMTPIRTRFRSNNVSTADIINQIREAQKISIAPTADASVLKRTTSRSGDSTRNFIHPYMKIDLGN